LLPMKQSEIFLHGWAMECRINAEDVDHNFRPCPGNVSYFLAPGGFGVRMDTHIYSGYTISPYYDSLIGKLIVHGGNRDEAISRMRRALYELVVDGVKTTAPFHERVLGEAKFQSGKIDTSYVEELLSKSDEDSTVEETKVEPDPAGLS